MKAVRCPICNGTGIYVKDSKEYMGTWGTCHGCDGKGWVEVQENPIVTYYTFHSLGTSFPGNPQHWGF